MILKITPHSISPGNPDTEPGPRESGYYVKIIDIPERVSFAQVILLYEHTVRKYAERDGLFEFSFSELCPTNMFPRHKSVAE